MKLDLSPPSLTSVCVYCGSSNAADPALLTAAAEFGRTLAQAKIRLVYGGGGVGLMGACARAAHEAGGEVRGVMPEFLRTKEVLYDEVDTTVVKTMHQRKQIMFEDSDAFVVLPGGIGTLEEVVELLSWKRLALHHKPVVFFSPDRFWQPLFDLIAHTIAHKLTPPSFPDSWRAVETVAEILPAIASMGVITAPTPADVQAAQLT